MTGEQNRTVKQLLIKHNVVEVHHGDCIGADEEFHNIAFGWHLNIVIHPPSKDKYQAHCEGGRRLPPKDYLDRNRDIVDASDFMIATPATFQELLRSGTWACIRYAEKVDKELYIVYPNGVINSLEEREA